MGVEIAAIDDHRLGLTGDVETLLDLPARAKTNGFSLAISDGSLIRGDYDTQAKAWRFTVLAEGAAIIAIRSDETGDRLHIAWRIDWITLACGSDTLCPIDADALSDTRQLVLDIDVKKAA